MTTLAVYTTVYPAVEKYLGDWSRSLEVQTDRDFQLWIGVDGVAVDDAFHALGGRGEITWVPAPPGETHAQVRQRALRRIVDECEAVVLVDSDDLLHPTRIEAARESLRHSDVTACALRLVDQDGADLGTTFGLPSQAQPDQVLPRHNVFGLSNSAYTTPALSQCLPLPDAAVLVDWFLVTRAWLRGLRLTFDRTVRMDYRQHPANTTHLLPPFSADRVTADTARVRHHLALLQTNSSEEELPDRRDLLGRVAADVQRFESQVVHEPSRLAQYVGALNELEGAPVWWWCVANPSLQHLWTSGEE